MPMFRNALSVPSCWHLNYPPMKMEQSVPKYWCLNYRQVGMKYLLIPTSLWRWNRQNVLKCWHLTLSDPMSDLVQHHDFPVPNAFLDL
jgi:hypothetical protein